MKKTPKKQNSDKKLLPISFAADTMKMMAINNKIADQLVDVFDWIFLSSENRLGLFELWSNLYGFDIVRFDKEVLKAGKISVAEYLEKNYGLMAVRLIQLFIADKKKQETYLESIEGKMTHSQLWDAYKNKTLTFGM